MNLVFESGLSAYFLVSMSWFSLRIFPRGLKAAKIASISAKSP